jgi:hypothetical protein
MPERGRITAFRVPYIGILVAEAVGAVDGGEGTFADEDEVGVDEDERAADENPDAISDEVSDEASDAAGEVNGEGVCEITDDAAGCTC